MSGTQVYQVGGQGTATIPYPPVQSPRDPTTSDVVGANGSPYNLLQQWINTLTDSIWTYTGAGVWVLTELSSGAVLTLSDTSGTLILPTAGGNIQIAGTANQITSTAGTNKDTLSIPSTFIAPGTIAATTTVTAGTGITSTLGNIVASAGNISATLGSVSAGTSVTAGTTLTATLGNITATNGNIVKNTAGNKDVYTSVATTITAGANSAGTVTLVGGTATISTTAITAASKVRLTRQSVGATGAAALGFLSIENIVATTSFDIRAVQAADATALQASDVSVIWWEIVN